MATAVNIPNLSEQPDGSVPADPNSLEQGQMRYAELRQTVAERLKPSPEDEGLVVEFYKHPLDGSDYVTIQAPGDKRNILDQPVNETHERRFARQWELYKQSQSQHAGQTMLRDCPWLDEASRTNLASFGVETLEQLAGVTDGNMSSIGPGTLKLRDRARTQLQEQEKVAQFDGIKAEMDEMRAELAALKAKRGPGRPPKVKSD